MALFKYRESGTYVIASQGTGTGDAGYQVIVTPKESWSGSVTLKQNTAPPGSTPVYVSVAYQNADTATEVAAGTAITSDAAVIVSPTAGDLIAVVVVTTGAVNIAVNPATKGVTNNELAVAFAAAGYETAGQDTPIQMLSAAVAAYLNAIGVEAGGNVGIGTYNPTTKLHVDGGSITVSDGGLRVRPPLDAASAWVLLARDFGLPVPYFTPLSATPLQIALDVFPKGTPDDFDAGRIGNAWIDVCSTDIAADGTNYESVRVQKFKNGVAAIGAASGGTGTLRGLVLQLEGGNVGIGTGTTAPSSLLTLNSSTLTGIELQDTTVARGYFAIANAAGNWFTNSVDGDVVIRGMGGRILLGSNASTPASTLVIDDGNTGSVGIGEDAPDYKLDVNGAIGFAPGASVTPVDNGDVVFELTNNTTLTIRAKGADGTVRSGTVTLS